MDFLAEHFPALLNTSLEGAILIVLVLAAQQLAGRRLTPQWRSALWLLVIVRLTVPWTIPSRVSVFNLLKVPRSAGLWTGTHGRVNEMDNSGGEPLGSAQGAAGDEVSSPRHRTAKPLWGVKPSSALTVWGAGVLAFSALLIFSQARLCRKFRSRRAIVQEEIVSLLEASKQEMAVRGTLPLFETPGLDSPCVLGFIRPALFLPLGFTQNFTSEEMRHVFLHELSHIKRKDILVGWVMSWLQVIHWFNPFVWYAARRMRLDRELACDAMALSRTGTDENEGYGRTIIKLLENHGRAAWTPSLAGAVENNKHMKERIRMIATFSKGNRGLPLAAALFCGLAIVTLTDAQSVPQSGSELAGTWVLIGRPGQTGVPPAIGGRIKTLTDHQWSVTQTDPHTGAILFRHGGTWKLTGDDYSETVEYANQNTRELVGKTSTFHISLEGDTLTIIGQGNPWKEVWRRVKLDAPKPKKLEPTALQGTWTGREAGGRSQEIATMQIQGTELEFHGGDTNEWYKATFSAFDTSPEQIVLQITDCPFAEYVGKTAYAICQIHDGKLTVTGNEPGNPTSPAGFDAPGARKFVFEKK